MLRRIFENIKFKQKGKVLPAFSMVEVIAVLFVITIGMTGIMSLITQNVQAQSVSRKSLVAYQLAQEGVELIRQVRDTNSRPGSTAVTWAENLSAGSYYMDYSMTLPVTANQLSDGRLVKNNDMYVSSPGDMSGGFFSRIITISYPDAAGEAGKMLINSKVYWTDRNNSFDYTIEAALYDWR